MRRLVWKPTLQWEFSCDACGEEIEDWHDVVLVRRPDALPEGDTDEYVVHEDCAESFERDHPGVWNKIRAASCDSEWLVYV